MRPGPRHNREMPMWVNALLVLALSVVTIHYIIVNWPSSLIDAGLGLAVFGIIAAMLTRYTSLLRAGDT